MDTGDFYLLDFKLLLSKKKQQKLFSPSAKSIKMFFYSVFVVTLSEKQLTLEVLTGVS